MTTPAVSNNPFDKNAFTSFRAWEEAYVFFLAEQLRRPSLAQWQALAADERLRANAAFSALMLADLAVHLAPQSEPTLSEIFPMLMKRQAQLDEYQAWYRSAWLPDRGRLVQALKHVLEHDLTLEQGSLLM